MNTRLHHHRGFSMIEVMVTLVVVAFGLLGLASLLLKGLQSGAATQARTVAVAQAYDIVERMRGNMDNVSGGAFNAVLPTGSSSNCTALLSAITDADETTIPIVGAASAAPTCASSDTTAGGLVNCWQEKNYLALPKGAGAICKSTTAGERWYAVIVSWDEDRTGVTNKSFWTIIEP